jgi:hypothetical protein
MLTHGKGKNGDAEPIGGDHRETDAEHVRAEDEVEKLDTCNPPLLGDGG